MTKLKTFEIWENVMRNDDSEKVASEYIKAKNIDNAVKRALKTWLNEEQRKRASIFMTDSDIESYIFETKYYDSRTGEELKNVDEYDEETMSYEDHELVIEEKEFN